MSKNTRSPIAAPRKRDSARIWNGPILGLLAALAVGPALAGSDYPPGLFENSPVVPSGQPDATAPSVSPDSADPESPDAAAQPDDYCASVAGRTFHSLEEVKRAHAICDPGRDAGPLAPADDLSGQ